MTKSNNSIRDRRKRRERHVRKIIDKLHAIMPDRHSRIRRLKRILSKSGSALSIISDLVDTHPSNSRTIPPIPRQMALPAVVPPSIAPQPTSTLPTVPQPTSTLPTAPQPTSTLHTAPQPTSTLPTFTNAEISGMLLVGDLLSLMLLKYKSSIMSRCRTRDWEDVWDRWASDGAPVYLGGTFSDKVRSAIWDPESNWTIFQVAEECLFVCGVLQLYDQRCKASHDRVSSKGKQELYSWIEDVRAKIAGKEVTFPTVNGASIVEEALAREQDYHFFKRNGVWWSKETNPKLMH